MFGLFIQTSCGSPHTADPVDRLFWRTLSTRHFVIESEPINSRLRKAKEEKGLSNDYQKMRKRWRDENDSKVHEEECNVLLRLIGYKSLAKEEEEIGTSPGTSRRERCWPRNWRKSQSSGDEGLFKNLFGFRCLRRGDSREREREICTGV